VFDGAEGTVSVTFREGTPAPDDQVSEEVAA
jgi:hypothetical protein